MSPLKHALVIDDDALNLKVLNVLLAAEGLSCVLVQDVSKMGAVIADDPEIDIVFLDLEMPHMDGYQAYGLLRNLLGSEVPIVACTVYGNEASTVRELGFQGFISKPLDPKRFPEQFNAIASGQEVWDS